MSSCWLSCGLYLLACLVGRLSWSVRSLLLLLLVVGRWSYRLVAPLAVGRRACWLLLSVVLSCLLLVVVLSCLEWPPRPPWVPSGGPTGDPQEGGAIFQKGGRGRPKPNPSPFLCARSKKMWFFSAKRGKSSGKQVTRSGGKGSPAHATEDMRER